MTGTNVESDSVTSVRARPPATEGPVIRLLMALRAGKPLEAAAIDAGLAMSVARCVAGSPLARVILGR